MRDRERAVEKQRPPRRSRSLMRLTRVKKPQRPLNIRFSIDPHARPRPTNSVNVTPSPDVMMSSPHVMMRTYVIPSLSRDSDRLGTRR